MVAIEQVKQEMKRIGPQIRLLRGVNGLGIGGSEGNPRLVVIISSNNLGLKSKIEEALDRLGLIVPHELVISAAFRALQP